MFILKKFKKEIFSFFSKMLIFLFILCFFAKYDKNFLNYSIVKADSNYSFINSDKNEDLNYNSLFYLPASLSPKSVLSTEYNDPRTQYDTPDPNLPSNIERFRVKTKPKTDEEIKNDLTENDIYQQIQNYKIGETVEVSTPDELLVALWGRHGTYQDNPNPPSDSNAPQFNITHIVLTKDIVITFGLTRKGYQSFTDLNWSTWRHIPNRNIVIDGTDRLGNKHTLEINGRALDTRISIDSDNYKSNFVMNNIKLQGTDYYGVVSAYTNATKKKIIYRNVSYQGSQLAASYATNITFTGKNDVNINLSYQQLEPKPITDSNGNVRYDVQLGQKVYSILPYQSALPTAYYAQQILECCSVTFAYNTEFNGFTANDIAFSLGYLSTNVSDINVMDHAKINITSSNQGSYQELGETAAISLRNGKMEIHPHATLNVNANQYVPNPNLPQGDVFNQVNTLSSRDLIHLSPSISSSPTNLQIDDFAVVNAKQTGIIDNSLTVSGAVHISNNSSINIGKWGQLHIISQNADSVINGIKSYSSKPVLYMDDNATISVDQPGTFDLQGDGEYSGSRSLIRLGNNSKFQFNRARLINIQYNGKQKNTNLISMSSGNMKVENMNIYAWNFGNSEAAGTNSDPLFNTAGYDYYWPTIFHFEANYGYGGFVGISNQASSLFPEDLTSLKANYNTDKFQRVMFQYIPTVYFGDFDNKPNDNPLDPNSYTIKGKILTDDMSNPDGNYIPLKDAYVRLTGHVKNTRSASEVGNVDLDQPFNNTISPNPRWSNIDVSGIDLTSNFSAITNDNGEFTVSLPKDSNSGKQKTFMASDYTDSLNTKPLENGRIQAFAFKNGNFNTANLEVEDKVAPTAKGVSLLYTVVGREALNPKSFIDLTTLKDLSPLTNSNAYTKLDDYNFSFAPQNAADNRSFWDTPGDNKAVYINVSDHAGNTVTVKSNVSILNDSLFLQVRRPNAVIEQPSGSDSWTDTQWQQWIKTNNFNDVHAMQINNDGTLTEITNQITNSSSRLSLGENDINYQVTNGSKTISANGKITVKTNQLTLKLPTNTSGNIIPINFGNYNSSKNGILDPKETLSYPVQVIDDRINQSNSYNVSVKADKFTPEASTIDLGFFDNSSNLFSNLIDNDIVIISGRENKNFDIITGSGMETNKKLKIKKQNVDNRLTGHKFETKLTWTLTENVP